MSDLYMQLIESFTMTQEQVYGMKSEDEVEEVVTVMLNYSPLVEFQI